MAPTAKERKERGAEQAIVREALAAAREEELRAIARSLAYRRRLLAIR